MKADLHCHSHVSDGSMAVEDVVNYAARIGLDYLALTDHDSMAGVKRAQAYAVNFGVHVVPGMEISTFDVKHQKKVHLLCYVPQEAGNLLDFCRETVKARNEASLKIIRKVAVKYPLDLKTVRKYAAGSEAICKQHIAMALTDMGYSLSVFGDLYWELFSTKNGWALIEPKYPDTREALSLIKQADGVAVLAHPGVYGNFDIIDELCGLGLDGIEVFHSRQSADDQKAAAQAAERYGLIKTGGSDFHGMFSTRVNPLASRTISDGDLTRFLDRCNAAEKDAAAQ